jgi:hypothetical protein
VKIKFVGNRITPTRISAEIKKRLTTLTKVNNGKIMSCSVYFNIVNEFDQKIDCIDEVIDITHGSKKFK